jgi:NADH-quinone oxidoreductase subunit N
MVTLKSVLGEDEGFDIWHLDDAKVIYQDMNIGSTFIDLTAITPHIFLALAAMAILLIGAIIQSRLFIWILSLAGLIVTFILSLQQWNVPQSGLYGMAQIDNYAVLFNVIFVLAAIMVILMARQYLLSRQIERYEFYPLIMLATLGMMIISSSSDLIILFLGLEIMSVPLYVMAGFSRKDADSNESSLKYFIMGAFATGFLLFGIAFIYGAAGTTDLRQIAANLTILQEHFGMFLYPGALLILIGFAFKVAAVPFHMWVPDVYQGAPTPVTAYFSTGPKAAGFAALLRIFICGVPAYSTINNVFWILAALTMTVGNILALRQNNIKRLLAYSSIAHAGYIMISLVAGGESAVASAIYYLSGYLFFNLGAFAIVTVIDSRPGSRAEIEELNGLSRRHPYLTAVLALFMFALAGFPPTAGFFGKFFVFSEAVRSGHIWLVIIGVLNSFVSVYYYLRIVNASYFGKSDREFVPIKYNPAFILVILIAISGTLILGLLPQYLITLVKTSLFPFI